MFNILPPGGGWPSEWEKYLAETHLLADLLGPREVMDIRAARDLVARAVEQGRPEAEARRFYNLDRLEEEEEARKNWKPQYHRILEIQCPRMTHYVKVEDAAGSLLEVAWNRDRWEVSLWAGPVGDRFPIGPVPDPFSSEISSLLADGKVLVARLVSLQAYDPESGNAIASVDLLIDLSSDC